MPLIELKKRHCFKYHNAKIFAIYLLLKSSIEFYSENKIGVNSQLSEEHTINY